MKKHILKKLIYVVPTYLILTALFSVAVFAESGEKSRFDAGPLIFRAVVCLAIGFLFALGITATMKSKLNSVRGNDYASEYIVPHSFTVTNAQEIYRYNKIDKVARPQERGEEDHHG